MTNHFDSFTAAAADAVDFTVTQDVEKLDKKAYPEFLQRIRNELGKLKEATKIEGVPVLPPQDESNPKRWFDLKLKDKDGKETTVRFQGDNLYVIGYQMHKSQQWLEFRLKKDKEKIPKSEPLGCRHDYGRMVSAANIKSLFKVSLTSSTFRSAVTMLAESTEKHERAKALIIMAQMVSEACRLDDISTFFTTNFDKTENFLQNWMLKDLEQNWGGLFDHCDPGQKMSWLQVQNSEDKQRRNQDPGLLAQETSRHT